ncbi:hypothetical protein [Nocardioides sp. GY 10127]|uniref:PspA-associated protein PspAB n=1 Tax=Nocardioides sp. GY 10127 TaxID=2569762 RepID=UPI0010A87BAF|nr:hypothetical protein [Nocardioides sp. GY 10127]TIC80913.1 hypothetical protein E8D37_13825 [Nocardioides sp. GY 10127]
MGFLDALLGRTKPKQANLDALFGIPSSAITLAAEAGLTPTGTGAVCYRAAGGGAFAQVEQEVVELLRADADAPDVRTTTDEFGFTWLVVEDDPEDLTGLVTDLHAVNTTLEVHGFGPGLLCSLLPFRDAGGRGFGLVYLYKQGTFYPFAPKPGGGRQRDTLLEIRARDLLAQDLPVEKDPQRWLAVWGAPGL